MLYTPAKLRELAAEQNTILENGRKEEYAQGFGPGNPGPMWRDVCMPAMKLRDQMLFAAAHMELLGIKERSHIGPFGNLDVKQGQKVRIKKGAPLFTMGAGPAGRAHKEEHGCHRFAKRDYVVVVSQNYQGWCDNSSVEHTREKYLRQGLRDQTIEWAGTGGYWTWTSPEWVEVI